MGKPTELWLDIEGQVTRGGLPDSHDSPGNTDDGTCTPLVRVGTLVPAKLHATVLIPVRGQCLEALGDQEIRRERDTHQDSRVIVKLSSRRPAHHEYRSHLVSAVSMAVPSSGVSYCWE